MKKIKHKKLLIALGVIVLILTGVCIYMFTGSSETNATKEISKGDKDTKSIIVYMSRSGVITKEPDKDADAVSSDSLNTSDGVTDDAARQLQKITGAESGKAKVLKGYRFSKSSDEDVKNWLKEIKYY